VNDSGESICSVNDVSSGGTNIQNQPVLVKSKFVFDKSVSYSIQFGSKNKFRHLNEEVSAAPIFQLDYIHIQLVISNHSYKKELPVLTDAANRLGIPVKSSLDACNLTETTTSVVFLCSSIVPSTSILSSLFSGSVHLLTKSWLLDFLPNLSVTSRFDSLFQMNYSPPIDNDTLVSSFKHIHDIPNASFQHTDRLSSIPSSLFRSIWSQTSFVFSPMLTIMIEKSKNETIDFQTMSTLHVAKKYKVGAGCLSIPLDLLSQTDAIHYDDFNHLQQQVLMCNREWLSENGFVSSKSPRQTFLIFNSWMNYLKESEFNLDFSNSNYFTFSTLLAWFQLTQLISLLVVEFKCIPIMELDIFIATFGFCTLESLVLYSNTSVKPSVVSELNDLSGKIKVQLKKMMPKSRKGAENSFDIGSAVPLKSRKASITTSTSGAHDADQQRPLMRAYSRIPPSEQSKREAVGVVFSNLPPASDLKILKASEWISKTDPSENVEVPTHASTEEENVAFIYREDDEYEFEVPRSRSVGRKVSKSNNTKESTSGTKIQEINGSELSALQAWLRSVNASPAASSSASNGTGVNYKRFKKSSIVTNPSSVSNVDLKLVTAPSSSDSQLKGNMLKSTRSMFAEELEDLRELDNVIMLDSQGSVEVEIPKKKTAGIKASQSPSKGKKGQGKKK
jgi:hypothetical protein